MRIHRNAHTHFYTPIDNGVLRDPRLSYCARGIVGYLLSLPDGQRVDIRLLTDGTPEGRGRVASAMRELERLGYLSRKVKHTRDGNLFTDVEVFETPPDASAQAAPDAQIARLYGRRSARSRAERGIAAAMGGR
jgi:hypothetical protein